MKLLDNSISHTRRALCTTTLVLLAGAVTAIAQSSSGSGSGTGASGAGAGGAGGSTYNQSASGTTGTSGSGSMSGSTDSSRRNSQSQSGTTRSGSTDSSYGTTGSTSGTGSMSGSTNADKLSWGDKRFVTKAADHGQSEVQIAQLATQQASNPEVRRFAQRLVSDHTRVNSELMSLASTKNVKLDKEDSQDRTYRRLSNRHGQDFDQEFVEQMIDMHEADIKLFEKASEDAKDQELRSFASRHLGHLREHLQQAQSLRSTIMPTGRDDASASGSTNSSAGMSGTGTSGTTGSSHSGAYQSSGGSTTSGAGGSRSNSGTTTGGQSGSASGTSSSTQPSGNR